MNNTPDLFCATQTTLRYGGVAPPYNTHTCRPRASLSWSSNEAQGQRPNKSSPRNKTDFCIGEGKHFETVVYPRPNTSCTCTGELVRVSTPCSNASSHTKPGMRASNASKASRRPSVTYDG